MEKSYYDLLGVSEDASTSDIERAYREKLKETHPDVSDEDDASERTKGLIEAKETLTDPDERDRYDRLGHENYVSVESATATDATSDSTTDSGPSSTTGTGGSSTAGNVGTDQDGSDWTASSAGSTSGTSTSSSGTNGGSWAKANGSGGQASTKGTTTGAAWNTRAQTTSQKDSSEAGTDRAWNRQRAYQVERGDDALRFGRVLSSQRALVLLGSTFVVYPVLLFGALDETFPLPVNLTVAMCVVLVVAFLQTFPEVGIVMFGAWTLLLPIMLFGLIGADPLAFRSLASLTAVAFPFGLSILTRIAIKPTSAS